MGERGSEGGKKEEGREGFGGGGGGKGASDGRTERGSGACGVTKGSRERAREEREGDGVRGGEEARKGGGVKEPLTPLSQASVRVRRHCMRQRLPRCSPSPVITAARRGGRHFH
jgi:hypothetical protein